jgi:hypothetical protein
MTCNGVSPRFPYVAGLRQGLTGFKNSIDKIAKSIAKIGEEEQLAIFSVCLDAQAVFYRARRLADNLGITLPVPECISFDLTAHIHRQRDFSLMTFGPGDRAAGVVDHIRKELVEIEKAPGDLSEWVDVILLAIDGAHRAGHSPEAICLGLDAKQIKNEGRAWPDWRTAEPGKAIEHVRT